MLTEKTIVDKIEVLESNHIQVRQANIIEKDGVEITRTFHRYVLSPGDSLEGQDTKVIAIANAVWSSAAPQVNNVVESSSTNIFDKLA
jgi:hypothetical protein